MHNRTFRRRVCGAAIGSVALVTMTVAGAHPATSLTGPALGFTPITMSAAACSADGLIHFANNSTNQPVTPRQLMQAGDPATPVNAPATSNKVGRVNDMVAGQPGDRCRRCGRLPSGPVSKTQIAVAITAASVCRSSLRREGHLRRGSAVALRAST